MTPAQAIAALDRQLAAHGQSVIHRRFTGSPRVPTDTPLRAFVRAVKEEEIVGEIKQTASKVIVSPTDTVSVWPIKESDVFVIDGKQRDISQVKPFKMDDELVRCELMVAG